MFSILGPTLGGYLSRPEENFPELTKRYPVLRDVIASSVGSNLQYRYYIPCFTAFLICLFILIMVLFCLPETLSKEDVRRNNELLKRSRVAS